MKEMISIIVPVYNVEKYIENCLNSIVNQTYKNIEVLVIDDGSTDHSGIICDKYARNDKRISVYHKKNGGLSSARNYGLRLFSGNYVVFIDSDDWIAESYVEELYNASKRYDAEITCCGKTLVDLNGSCFQSGSSKNMVLSSKEAIKRSLFDDEVGVAAWAKIYSQNIIRGMWFPEGEIHEDVAIMYQLFDKCDRIAVIAQYGYFYRYNSEGISKQNYSAKFNVVLKHMVENELFILKKYPELQKGAQAATASACVDMMIKIFKTPNGLVKFHKEFLDYKKYLCSYAPIYKKYIPLPWKRKVWIHIFLYVPPKIMYIYDKFFNRIYMEKK